MNADAQAVARRSVAGYRPDIDGLRAIAILGVVFFHAAPTLLPGGFAGVDVFFVISGYLITTLLQQDIATGAFSIATFYQRRIRRILPALLLVMSVVWLLGYALMMPGELRRLGKSMVYSAFFANNFMLVAQAGYFDVDAELKPLLNLWSLAVEEQFYILWPWLLALATRLKAAGKWLVAALALASLLWSISFSDAYPVRAFFLPHYRFWELLAGALVAMYAGWLDFSERKVLAGCLGIVGLACIAATYVWLDGHQPYPGWRAMFPVAGACLLIMVGRTARLGRWVLSSRLAVGIGLISYPLYLWHWPLLSIGRILFGELSRPLTGGILAVSVALSWMTYRYVEMPVRQANFPMFRLRLFPAATLLLLVFLGGLGDATSHAEGFPQRIGSQAWRALEWPESRIRNTDCAHDLPLGGDYCQRWTAGTVSHLLIGDSHANHFFPGLAKALAEKGGNLLQIQGPVSAKGYEKNGANLEWLARQPQIKTVFIAYHSGRMKQADNPFDEGVLGRLIADVERMGKRVVFIVDSPEFDFDPRLCTNRPILAESLGAVRKADDLCVESLDYSRRKRADYDAYVATLAQHRPRVRFVDAFKPFCGDGKCYALRDGMPMFRDRHHLSVPGSEFAFAAVTADFP